ncbi:hypothetical protein F5X99DRAFT_41195 [Biscogniauxia marginata]|nr:hypothetical protein F5X99DRAFT_41195 [Biscogniauxia marginata]
MSAPNDVGPLVRLWGIRTQDLPPQSATADELAPFLASILKEAVPFIDSAAPKSTTAPAPAGPREQLWKPRGTKSHPDSAARVEVSERVIPARDLLEAAAAAAAAAAVVTGDDDDDKNEEEKKKKKEKKKMAPETWACRRSVHEDAARRGTASWAEFERCFRDDHAQSERRFTPNVVGAREALRWGGCAGVTLPNPDSGGARRWGRFGLAVVEMRHKVGRPVLKDRTFPVLQMTCSLVDDAEDGDGDGEEREREREKEKGEEKEFLVVSIPVPDFGAASEASTLAREKDAQVAVYVSVERVRKLPAAGDSNGDIEWLMATASDAAGVLPIWVQNMAMPGVIWKDVPLFLGWIAGERDKGKDRGPATGTGD